MISADNEWLKLTEEKAIEADLPICDPHHHLWYPADGGYTLEEFQRDISGGHRIVQTVFIESRKMLKTGVPGEMQPVGETEYICDLLTLNAGRSSPNSKIAAGIVGFADLTLGAAVAPVLEAHIVLGRERFKGIRYPTTWDTSKEIKSSSAPGIMSSPEFIEGFSRLQTYSLSFDAWMYYPQLVELANLAAKFPDTPIVIDHTGGPLGIGPYAYASHREAVFHDWKKFMERLAGYSNVYLKLGGLGMELCGFAWNSLPRPPGSVDLAVHFAPYFLWCIERFGVDRCMFESNFPVDKKSYSYTVLWNAFKRVVHNFSKTEKQALFHNTAARFYRLS